MDTQWIDWVVSVFVGVLWLFAVVVALGWVAARRR
jgi:hypothetical protein